MDNGQLTNMQTTHHTPTVLSFATSLLELAEQDNISDSVGEELNQIGEILEANPHFVLYLADPAISQAAREGVLRAIFGGKVSPLLWNFLGVLNLKNRLPLLEQIIAAYDDLMDEKHGKIEVDVTTAHKLSPDELQMVQQRVSAALKKDAVIHQYVDDSLIGGMLLRVGDQMIDASVKSQLQAIKQKIMSSRSS
jgi:F-type H+-transporting ATPase subunit delta